MIVSVQCLLKTVKILVTKLMSQNILFLSRFTGIYVYFFLGVNTFGIDIKGAVSGWKMYWEHPVRNAGVGLALLYMTVLGFDNITYGYIIAQSISEAVLGGVVALSALIGVAGSVAYPFLRKCLGLEKTGLVGIYLQVQDMIPK